MKYYIIAGEASGDLHGSNLIKSIKNIDSDANIRCWGGDLMKDAGGDLVKHYKDLAFMGFVEVIANLPTILNNIKFCKKDIQENNPDVLVLIDYPGFNLRIAQWAKLHQYKVVYYISPQVWAWKANRVKMMKQCIDQMFVILPFEKKYFSEKWNWNVEYVGHPLIEAIETFRSKPSSSFNLNRPIIALLPGSRKQEIRLKLPIMLSVVSQFPDYEFVIAKAPGIENDFYDAYIKKHHNVRSMANRTYELLEQCCAALVTSGTATLETALFKVPQVVCYRGNEISYQIARRVIRVPFISLVNLIMNKLVVQELIQHNLTTLNLQNALQRILPGGADRERILSDYEKLSELLQTDRKASDKVASGIFSVASRKSIKHG